MKIITQKLLLLLVFLILTGCSSMDEEEYGIDVCKCRYKEVIEEIARPFLEPTINYGDYADVKCGDYDLFQSEVIRESRRYTITYECE